MTEQTAEQRAVPVHRPSGVTVEVAELIRHIGIVGIVGVSLGLIVGGIGGRVLMRIAAVVAPDRVTGLTTENGNVIGDITVGGTIALLIFVGILFGGIGAVAYVISERWLSWTGAFRPLVFSILLLAVASPIVLHSNNIDFLLVGNYELIVGMFGALFLLYGIPLPLLASALERRLPEVNPDRPLQSVGVYLGLVGFGGIFALFLVVVALDDNNLALFLFLGMGLATALYWADEYSDLVGDPWPNLGRVLGYGALIGAAVFGTLQTWGAIADILAGNFF